LLALGLVLVFFGTLAQEPLGLHGAQQRYFQSFFVDAAAFYGGLHKFADMILQGFGHPLLPLDSARLMQAPRIPVLPGGYMIGGLLIINLIAAHFRYYQPGKRKIGIILIHLGIVMLLVGQLLTDFLAIESTLHLRNGETKNYSEADQHYELAIVDSTDPKGDKVVAIPGHRLTKGGDVNVSGLPFTVHVKTYYPNSSLVEKAAAGYQQVEVTAGIGSGIWWRSVPHETAMNRRDIASGIVEIVTPQGSLGSYLVSAFIERPQQFVVDGRVYQMMLRLERYYKPYSLQLLEFRHDKYPGTEIPKNFSSRVRLVQPDTKEDREVLIKMNTPLRYKGETYYQSSFDPDNQGSVLQVVRNPGWLTPYLGCIMVSAGLIYQFLAHLIGFATKRRTK
jgi:hypothetical protein